MGNIKSTLFLHTTSNNMNRLYKYKNKYYWKVYKKSKTNNYYYNNYFKKCYLNDNESYNDISYNNIKKSCKTPVYVDLENIKNFNDIKLNSDDIIIYIHCYYINGYNNIIHTVLNYKDYNIIKNIKYIRKYTVNFGIDTKIFYICIDCNTCKNIFLI